ncbi:interferon-induced GTP-binding protein mx2 [Beauveria brongniartii RCEF 3172]|uniref:Interferon-induced GTP-binding protein mx2 n=1 Tax=Beauveria brongniartii RCEF 3172 TaxID=1081107 RepID=A0A162JZH1_9HYPO|nr:interferon-induced GTP-binding protein mx2 [Beauveria brongniartii RCEF 3172]
MATEPSFDDSRYSREYHLPGGTIQGRPEPLKVTYADFGYRNVEKPDEENVFLFFPPLLGSRWMHIAKDNLAKKHRVRVINVERPGYGGTDEVELQDRLRVWQDVIPALLTHLNIRYVSVGCHSAGTVYALDFILHHPEFLHPERPYLAIAGPWILPTQSGVISMRIAQSLPAVVIGRSESLARFMRTAVNPALGAGASAVSSLFGVVARSIGVADAADPQPDSQPETEGEMEMRLRPTLLSRAYGENLQGLGADAVLMMHKVVADADADAGGVAGWSDWGDYEAYVPRLAEALRASGRKLTVDAFHAETDSMVGDYGDQGPTWFDACWAADRCGDGTIVYSASCVDDADHDLVWSIKFGVPEKVFLKIGVLREKKDETHQDSPVDDDKTVEEPVEEAAEHADGRAETHQKSTVLDETTAEEAVKEAVEHAEGRAADGLVE